MILEETCKHGCAVCEVCAREQERAATIREIAEALLGRPIGLAWLELQKMIHNAEWSPRAPAEKAVDNAVDMLNQTMEDYHREERRK